MPTSPAEHVIKTIGGVRKTARALGRSPSAICKWRKPRSRQGTGGAVPGRVHIPILAYAKKHKLDILPADLIQGR